MSMELLTIYQMIYIFAAYTVMVILVPALIFYRRFAEYTLPERLMAYVVIGNFFMMNIVFILELLHIAYKPVIIIASVVVIYVAAVSVRKKDAIGVITDMIDTLRRRMSGVMGQKQLSETLALRIKSAIVFAATWTKNVLLKRLPEWLGFWGVMGLMVYIFGPRDLSYYSYSASDMIVHNYWINALSENRLFADGIYPMGYHNVIFYLHIVFGMETYTLLRLFGIVQLFYIIMMLFMFIRALTKGALFPALGAFIFFGLDIWNDGAINRYVAPLPQEFGIIFILPAIYFLMRFLKEERGREKLSIPIEGQTLLVDEADLFYSEGFDDTGRSSNQKLITVDEVERRRKRVFFKKRNTKRARISKTKLPGTDFVYRFESLDSVRMLTLFALSFSMTIAVHFYDTIIAGLGCVAVAVGFLVKIFKRDYFVPIFRAGVVSLVLAIYPMAISFAMGTPLQGSMYWALGVMEGDNKSDTDKDVLNKKYEERIKNASSTVWRDGVIIGIDGEPVNGATYEDLEGFDTETVTDASAEGESAGEPTAIQRYMKKFWAVYGSMQNTFSNAIVNSSKYSFNLDLVLYVIFAVAFVMSFAVRDRDVWYGRCFFSVTLFSTMIMLIFILGDLGLPQLMDINRGRVFFVYVVSAAITIMFDSLPYMLVGNIAKGRLMYGTGFLCVAVLLTGFVTGGAVRTPLDAEGTLGRNGAIVCLTGITREIPDNKWTIVSANDEMRMGEDHGFHYEAIDLIRKNANYTRDKKVFIPTEYVFFFIEKVPVDYAVEYSGSGQSVSPAGADRPVPEGTGLGIYQGENRWIVMSKLYYYMKAFKELYPNEVETYYEDKDFVCYMIKQNERSLYNLAIDYGFNGTYTERKRS